MTRVRSGLLAVWGSAWLAGRAPYDELTRVVAGRDEPHRVLGLHEEDVPLLWALSAWRERGATALRVVLAAPGDPRGLPGPGPFTTAALAAGEAVLAAGFGLVPEITRHGSELGSKATTVRWHAYDGLPDRPDPDPLSPGEAEHALTTALKEAAGALADLDAASWRPEAAEGAARLRRSAGSPLPPGTDPRAVRLLAQADRLAAVLDLAAQDDPGGALTSAAAAARSEALRPLAYAVRKARMAAYNAVPRP